MKYFSMCVNMNSILAYVSILTILTSSVRSVLVSSVENQYDVTIDAPFYFGYNRSEDSMYAHIFFYNLSPTVTYTTMLYKQGPSSEINIKDRLEIEAGKTINYNFGLKLVYQQTFLHLMLEINTDCYKNITIFEGISTDYIQSDPKYKNDDRCFKSSPCKIQVYLQNECAVLQTNIVITFATADNPQISTMQMVNITTTTTSSVTHIDNYNTFKSETSTREDIESTTNKNSVVNASTETSTLVIVLSSLFSVLFIVLVVIAIWICCNCNKQSPQGILGVQTNRTEPFYLNMLFRRECDQEIYEIEQHHYEEIGS